MKGKKRRWRKREGEGVGEEGGTVKSESHPSYSSGMFIKLITTNLYCPGPHSAPVV